MERQAISLSESTHLNFDDKINFGSFYTPLKYVHMAGEWMVRHGIGSEYVIFDPSCGYGSFFRLRILFFKNRFVGNDIDSKACFKAKGFFPRCEMHNNNIFMRHSRKDYSISDDEKLIIVGNPPYNDTTSQIRQELKSKSKIDMSDDVRSNDLGVASLLCYNWMRADYVLVLHPLSYLIKRTNFGRARNFFSNYKMVEHIVFSSQEFAGTSKSMGFPIVLAMYERHEGGGMQYDDVFCMRFNTVEGKCFALNERRYISEYISKYPGKFRFDPEILFYTMRDVNALKRSRTFISSREANAVDVDPSKIVFYCYADCFKRFASAPYYMGNFDIPLIVEDINRYASDIIAVSKYMNKDIFARFGDVAKASDAQIENVRRCVARAIDYKGEVENGK